MKGLTLPFNPSTSLEWKDKEQEGLFYKLKKKFLSWEMLWRPIWSLNGSPISKYEKLKRHLSDWVSLSERHLRVKDVITIQIGLLFRLQIGLHSISLLTSPMSRWVGFSHASSFWRVEPTCPISQKAKSPWSPKGPHSHVWVWSLIRWAMGSHNSVDQPLSFFCRCSHYRRIKAPCCSQGFDLRHCHNEAKVSDKWSTIFLNLLITRQLSCDW